MKLIKEVREFGKICCNESLEGNSEYTYIPKTDFYKLVNFIRELANEKEHTDIWEFMKIIPKKNVGDVISVNNYVGLIQINNGCQIQILPKIDFINDDEHFDKTKKVFLRMLRCLKDFPSKVFKNANFKTERMTLYEIFINMYLQDVRTLIKHGIKSAYISNECNLNFYKGKLAVNEHFKHNFAHAERFFVRFDEYMVDRAENRLVKSTLLKLLNISSSPENQKEIRQLLSSFEMVKSSTNYQKDFSKVVNDRSTKDYDSLMRWSRVFLMNKSFTTFSGESNARALLFPMEKVFESFVAQQLRKILIGLGWEISIQDKGYYLFNSPPHFLLKPDIVITRKDNSKIILDTKWKSLVNNPGLNYGISQSDMYQMYAYAKKYNTSDVWLAYPANEGMKDCENIIFKSDDDVSVRLFFVDLADENCLVPLLQLLKREESECYSV